jgi:hypothetical protein
VEIQSGGRCGLYEIVSVNSGKCLDISGASESNGTVLQQWDCGGAGSLNQLWQFNSLDDGSVQIISAAFDGKCVDVTARSLADGALVQQWDCGGRGSPNQLWKLGLSPITNGTPTPTPGSLSEIYVSPSGSDLNHGTLSSPLATLQAAQKAARLITISPKHIYLRGGTYHLSSMLTLTSEDNGEIWSTYAQDGVDSAIIDGAGTTSGAFLVLGGSNITFDSLTLRNFLYWGIGVHGGNGFSDMPLLNVTTGVASGNTVSNCDISNINLNQSDLNWNSGAVVFQGSIPNSSVIHNYFHNSGSMGMRISAERAGDDISGALIQNNVVTNSVQLFSDGGAIYLQDTNHTSVNIKVNGNLVRDFQGVGTSHAVGIYLDDGLSNASVTGNIVGPPMSVFNYLSTVNPTGWNATFSTFIHGGSNNKIVSNLFDVGSNPNSLILQLGRSPVAPTPTGNVFEGNLIVSKFSGSLGPRGCSVDTSFPSSISGNQFYSYGSSPITSAYVKTCDDPKAILNQYPNLSLFLSQSNTWGPPGIKIPAGTPSSY